MNGEHLEKVFWNQFSHELVGDILRLLAQEIKGSAVECYTSFPKQEAGDLLGSFRRARVESKLRDLSTLYPGLKAQAVSKQKSGLGNFHTELEIGNSRLTTHKVQYQKTPVRKAKYRDSIAKETNYGLWIEETTGPEELSLIENPILYAVLKYGVDKRIPQMMAFAVIDFPSDTGNVIHRLNLLGMDQYAGIPAEFVRFSTQEEIEDNLNLNFRSDAKKKAREEDGDDIANEK